MPASLKVRWTAAVEKAQQAIGELMAVQSEYQDRFDNLSETAQEGERGEAIQAVLDIDLESADSTVDEAAKVDLP